MVAGSLAIFSVASSAGIVPIISVALELIQAIPSSSPPVAGASASIGLNGGASLGTLAQSFSGLGIANASVDIDRFRQTSARATASWEYVFMVAQPGITDIVLNYTYSTSESVYTNFNANSRATASVFGLEAFLNVGAFEQYLSWPDLTASGDCSSSGLFDDCGPSPKAFAAAYDKTFHYDPGYPVGTRIRILGDMFADAFGHTGAGSAESSAHTSASFSIRAIPLPGTLALSLLALTVMYASLRRSTNQARAIIG
jgi:hypothetical protein